MIEPLLLYYVDHVVLMQIGFFSNKIYIYMKRKEVSLYQPQPNIRSKTMTQRAKKVVSDSTGLMDFAIGLVIFFNLPPRQVLFLGEIQITEGL